MKDANELLTTDLLDILFEGRNKMYGAYELRKHYSRRLAAAVISMLFTCFLMVAVNYLYNKNQNEIVPLQLAGPVQLEQYKEQPKELPIPPKPPIVQQQKIQTAHLASILIVKNEEVNADEMPPEVEVIDKSKIGLVNMAGVEDDGTQTPPAEAQSVGSVIAPRIVEPVDETVFSKVENPAEFPGGAEAWRRYLERNLRYPAAAQENGTQAIVRVQFVVDRDGNISEVQALDNPGDGLAEEAVRIIKSGPRWKPAEQNGSKVIFRHIQSISFRIEQ